MAFVTKFVRPPPAQNAHDLMESGIRLLKGGSKAVEQRQNEWDDSRREKYARRICRRIYSNSYPKLSKILRDIPSTELNDVLCTTMVYKILDKDSGEENAKHKKGENIEVHKTPINFAFCISSREICEFLHDTCSDFLDADFCKIRDMVRPHRDPYLGSIILCAAENKNSNVLKFLLEKRPELSKFSTVYKNTPLHYACFAGQFDNFELLREAGARYYIANKDNQVPLHWAACGGNPKLVKRLYDLYAEDDKKLKETTLTAEDCEKYNTHQNYGEDCFKIQARSIGVPLLFAAKGFQYDCIEVIFDNQKEADGTVRDDECDTTLHYVSQDPAFNDRPYDLAKILKANALLGVKNIVGNTPLDWISPMAMETVLNRHIHKVELPKDKIDVSQKDRYEIMFTNLFGHHASGSDVLNILALAQSSKHQELALHPVCQSILSAKWQKMKKYFVIKLLFFIPFVVMLSLYPVVLSDFEKNINKNGSMIAEDAKEARNRINLLWCAIYIMWLIQVIFGSMSVLVLIRPFWSETKSYMAHWSMKRVNRFLEYCWVQIVWSDWYEYMLWVMAILLLHGLISPIPVVLVSWFSLFLVCSNHPSVLPFRYILVKILFRYIKFLLFAFGLISGFAMGFYLLMRECKVNDSEPCANGAFTNIYTTALKVPAMMMGEISFEAFPVDISASPYVYFLLGAFIFLITCCLFNMMNGLAINITQEMMQKAHIFKTIAQCDMIYEFEVMLTEISALILWLGLGKINFLSPLWVERLKASPSTGKCLNLDEYNEDTHGSQKQWQNKKELLWETNKAFKVKWIWVDRGYALDRKIIYEANVLIERLLTKEKKESEEAKVDEIEKRDARGTEDAECDETYAWIAKRKNDRLKKHSVIYQDPANDESSDDEATGVTTGKLLRQDSVVDRICNPMKMESEKSFDFSLHDEKDENEGNNI